MSAPLIWIVFPILMGGTLVFFQRWRVLTSILGLGTTSLLALVVRFLPLGEPLVVGSFSLIVHEQFQIAGAQFNISGADRSWIVLLSLAMLAVQTGALFAKIPERFIPLSLIILGLFFGVLTISPIFYAAIFIEIASLIGVLMMASPDKPPNTGLIRFLIFQTIGVIILLFAGAFNLEVIGEPSLSRLPELLLGLGFAVLFSIFPLYFWIPMVLDDSHPYAVVSYISIHYGVIILFLLEYFQLNLWLFSKLDFFDGLRFAGVVLIATAGAWAAFQRHLGRILGFAIGIEIGYSLVTIGLRSSSLHFALVLPRLIALLTWGLALTQLQSKVGDLRFRTVQGFGRLYPFLASGVLFSNFSLAGLPLLASFPILVPVWQELVQLSSTLAIWTFLGSIGLLVGGLRSMAVLVMGPEELPAPDSDQIIPAFVIGLGVLLLLLIGLFPHWVWPWFSGLAQGLDF